MCQTQAIDDVPIYLPEFHDFFFLNRQPIVFLNFINGYTYIIDVFFCTSADFANNGYGTCVR